MGDITSIKALYLKAALFLLAGAICAVIILIEAPTVKVAILLAVAIWCFARAYYFAFYVIEHYVDPSFRFSGLTSFVKYALKRKQGGGGA